jgi:hypothetical protein
MWTALSNKVSVRGAEKFRMMKFVVTFLNEGVPGSLYQEILIKHLFTETPFDQTPFGRSPFDQKVI